MVYRYTKEQNPDQLRKGERSNRVQNQGKLFDELWAAEDDEDEEGQDGTSNTNGLADPKVESGKGVYPPEHEGWLMKQGGTFKSWKHRYMVLSHFCLSYYASEEHYKEGKKPKGNIRVNDESVIHNRQKKNLKTHPFGFILSASEGQTKKRRDYQMCSDTIEVNGVWIAKLRATVNLAKKLKKEGEAKSQKRRSQIIGDASASQIGNGISGNTADAGGQPSDTSSFTTSSGERHSTTQELQREHERDPYYLLKQRVNKAKVLAWNRRAKSALDFGKQFSNKKENMCQLELSFKLENLFIFPSHGTGKQSTLQYKDNIAGSATVHSVYIVISRSPEIPMRLTNEQVAHAEAWDYKPCFKSDEVLDSRNPLFST